MSIPVRPALSVFLFKRTDRWETEPLRRRGNLLRRGNLFAPGTASALAFEHADCLAAERVKYATDDVELGVALRAPSAFSGLFACEFFATEEIHFRPLHEQGNKCQQHRRS